MLCKLFLLFNIILGQMPEDFFYSDFTQDQKQELAPIIYEEYECADVIHTQNSVYTILWKTDIFGVLQPYVVHCNYQIGSYEPVLMNNSLYVYDPYTHYKEEDETLYISVYRMCEISGDIAYHYIPGENLQLPQLRNGLAAAIFNQSFQYVQKGQISEKILEVYRNKQILNP